jgi:hypothetical protein
MYFVPVGSSLIGRWQEEKWWKSPNWRASETTVRARRCWSRFNNRAYVSAYGLR